MSLRLCPSRRFTHSTVHDSCPAVRIMRCKRGPSYDPPISGAGPNSANSRTLGTRLNAEQKISVNGYFGLYFSEPNQTQWRRILHPCRRKRSYQSFGNEQASLPAGKNCHTSKVQPSVNGAYLQPASSAFITLDDAAKMIGCCRRFLEKRIADGEIKAFKPSKRIVRIRLGELERFIECYSSGGEGRT